MKTYHIFRPLFLLSLFICGVNHCKAMNISDDSQDDIPDRLTFGLVGDVKEVQISITDNSDDMVDDPINEEQVMTFDKEGRVTRDIHDCEYVYDTQGRFIKGEKEYTKMVRDKKGRIKSYETRLDDEDAECYCYTYEYDLNGRPTTIGLQLWEGVYTHTFTYSGNNIYQLSIFADFCVVFKCKQIRNTAHFSGISCLFKAYSGYHTLNKIDR